MDYSPGPRPHGGPSDTKLPSIGQLLLTPPNSTEMPKEHSFPPYYDDHGHGDHALFPTRRSPSLGSQASNAPLFSPLPRLQPSSQAAAYHGHPEPEHRQPGATLPPPDGSARQSSDPRFHKYITSHQSQFQHIYPGSSAPKEEHYQLFMDFLGEIRTRKPGSSPPQPAPAVLQETSPNRPSPRMLAPQYAPYFPASPAKRPAVPAHSDVPEQSLIRSESPMKRRRMTSELSDSLPPSEDSPQQQRRRRSAQSTRKRSSTGGGVAKETKHNRNRSTKEKKSTNFEDYPDFTPALDTMQNPMEAAMRVPEHKVNTRKDLSADPLRHELHDAERTVAQRLNIGCAEYLVFKRQVFDVYVQYLRDSQSSRGQWNKTRAQQAGNLDVGKASQIWVFWKNVGWFDEDLFKAHL